MKTKTEYNKQYYAATAEDQKEKSRQWRRDNPEKVKKQDAKKHAANGPYSSWSEEEKIAHRAAVRRWRAAHPEEYKASQEKTNSKRRERYATDENFREKAKATSRLVMPESQRKRRTRLKKEVFSHYGYACACCGETEESFLTIDHVNNDGAKHRKEMKSTGTGANLYLDIIRRGFPTDFEVACYNCNCGRAKTGGICAHKRSHQANAPMLQSNEASTIDTIM